MPVSDVKYFFSIDLPQLRKYDRYAAHNFKPYTIKGLASIESPADHTVMFAKNVTAEVAAKLACVSSCLIFIPDGQTTQLEKNTVAENEVYECDNPRMEYAVFLSTALKTVADDINTPGFNNYVSPKAQLGKNVIIEDGAYVDDDVVIGDGSIIKSGARIYRRVRIGKGCIVGPNTVVGNHGFGIEKDDNGNNVRVPHFGGVTMGDHVEIGALTTIVSGTIQPTVIDDYAMIDDHVHVAHNVRIGKNAIITACTLLSGGVEVKENGWLGPNSSVRQKLVIGKDAFVGIGAVVLKDVAEGQVIVGNPGKPLEKK